MKLVLITGLSGAGKSVALRALEDAGFEAIDNMPLSLIGTVAGAQGGRNTAIGTDIRSRDFSQAHFSQALAPLQERAGVNLSVVYLDCDDEVLQRRFTETRRPHPLAQDRPVMDGIRQERALIQGLREKADFVLDTSALSAQELRRLITAQVAGEEKKLTVTVTSFSFKKGLPREADMVLDVRFLKNPFYEPALKDKTGRDAEVGAHISGDKDFAGFMQRAEALVLPLLPRYRDEGKHYLTLAIGCTGGRHRSVFVAEQLAARIREAGFDVDVRHRDVEAI